MLKKGIFLVSLFLLISCMALVPSKGALAQVFCNGDFESGDLSDWYHAGDVAVTGSDNVISDTYTAYITTSSSAVGEMCSFLFSEPAYPEYVPIAVDVSFLVRYKTNNIASCWPYEDPFTAELALWFTEIFEEPPRAMEIVTIKADGITPGPNATVCTVDEHVNTCFYPPVLPPLMTVENGYRYETPTLVVRQRIQHNSCNPVHIKFSICDWWDASEDSAAYLDDVVIDFLYPSAAGVNTPRKGDHHPPLAPLVPCERDE